ncbi:hypothetical protein B0H11DRAFT_1900694 [Mycena galericulata]|nr:hypothetical protein B0H11DRAFT_1900694 [Mycena galericulata]
MLNPRSHISCVAGGDGTSCPSPPATPGAPTRQNPQNAQHTPHTQHAQATDEPQAPRAEEPERAGAFTSQEGSSRGAAYPREGQKACGSAHSPYAVGRVEVSWCPAENEPNGETAGAWQKSEAVNSHSPSSPYSDVAVTPGRAGRLLSRGWARNPCAPLSWAPGLKTFGSN